MAFAQNMQAYLIDRYYRYLHDRFPEQAEDALLTAFHRYMFQQGNRAAQRAVRDGKPLDFENYECYREVVSTGEMKREDVPHGGERDWAQIGPYLDSNFDIYYPLGLKKK